MKTFSIRSDHGEVSEEKITSFEGKYSIKLPASFKLFVAKHDAPWVLENHFKFNNVFSESHGWPYKIIDSIDSRDLNFLGFNDSVCDGEKIDDCQDFDVFGHDHVIAFGIAANGDYICFDYRHDPSTSEPHVVVMFHDAYDDQRKMLICHVANSFDDFMDSLYKSD